jgi:hypothetical protein
MKTRFTWDPHAKLIPSDLETPVLDRRRAVDVHP